MYMIRESHHDCTNVIEFGVSFGGFYDSVFCFPHIAVPQMEIPGLMRQAVVLGCFQEAPGVWKVQGNVYSYLDTFSRAFLISLKSSDQNIFDRKLNRLP